MKTAIWIMIVCVIIPLIVTLVVRGMTNKEVKQFSAKEILEKKNFTEADAKAAIQTIQKEYGKEMASVIEKMLRLETSHFKSMQYKLTGSAGMEEGKWKNIPPGATAGTVPMKDNHDGHIGKFIVWNSVTDFARYLAEYIKRYSGNYARWNTTNPEGQKTYAAKVNTIKARFVA